MVARLWWKEARLFWPIAAFLVLVAELAQGLAVYYFGNEARTGVLAVMAFGWTCLYAFAVAAASLAGERENGTLLAARRIAREAEARSGERRSRSHWGRRWPWGCLLLRPVSLSRRETWELLGPPERDHGRWASSRLLQVLGWGFFWSAVCSHALTAAVLAVCSMGLTMPLFEIGLNFRLDTRLRSG